MNRTRFFLIDKKGPQIAKACNDSSFINKFWKYLMIESLILAFTFISTMNSAYSDFKIFDIFEQTGKSHSHCLCVLCSMYLPADNGSRYTMWFWYNLASSSQYPTQAHDYHTIHISTELCKLIMYCATCFALLLLVLYMVRTGVKFLSAVSQSTLLQWLKNSYFKWKQVRQALVLFLVGT